MEKIDTGDILTLAAVVVGFSLVSKVFQGLGIWDSPATKHLDAESSDPGSPWNPNYYRQFQNFTYAIDTKTAMQYASEMLDAFGPFNDCEECVISIFKRLRTKSNLSFLSDVFSQGYGQDLLSYLRGGTWPQDRLSDADVNFINDYINQLPTN